MTVLLGQVKNNLLRVTIRITRNHFGIIGFTRDLTYLVYHLRQPKKTSIWPIFWLSSCVSSLFCSAGVGVLRLSMLIIKTDVGQCGHYSHYIENGTLIKIDMRGWPHPSSTGSCYCSGTSPHLLRKMTLL